MCGYAWYVGVGVGFVQGMCGNVWVCFNMCGASILHIPMVFAFPTLDCFGFLLAFGSYPVYGQHTKQIDTPILGFVEFQRRLSKSLQNRVRLVDQDLVFLGCPPTVGGHGMRSIFGSGIWTPNWAHAGFGYGDINGTHAFIK